MRWSTRYQSCGREAVAEAPEQLNQHLDQDVRIGAVPQRFDVNEHDCAVGLLLTALDLPKQCRFADAAATKYELVATACRLLQDSDPWWNKSRGSPPVGTSRLGERREQLG